jgi:hypothetical protein
MPLIERHVRDELIMVERLCFGDPGKYGSVPQDIFLIEHKYIMPVNKTAPWESHPQRGLLRAIGASQKALYGKRAWKTPPEVGGLPISRGWKMGSERLIPVHPSILRSVACRELKDIGSYDQMYKLYNLVRVRFTCSDDVLEVYLDTQWSPMKGSGLTFEVTRGSEGICLRFRMRRWSS